MDSPTRTSSRIGTQSSSRAGGRSMTGDPAPLGAADGPAAARPRPSSAATGPGVIVDSATSNRSTANLIGALGSFPPVAADAEAVGDLDGAAVAEAPADDPAATRTGVAV